MPIAIVTNLPMVGSEDQMKKFQTGIRQFVNKRKAKVADYAFDNGIVTIRVDNEVVFGALCDNLKQFDGVKITKVADALGELLIQYPAAEQKP
jgi:uncharacterized protein (UPF0303 family)